MSDFDAGPSALPPDSSAPAAGWEADFAEPPGRQGHPLLAWLAILLMVGLVVARQFMPAVAGEGRGESQIGLMLVEMQGKYIVATADFMRQFDPKAVPGDLLEQARALNTGSFGQRVRFVVLAGELKGPEAALHQLDRLMQAVRREHVDLSPEQQQLVDVLRRLYGDYDKQQWAGPNVGLADRDRLRQDLDWFGDLALHPQNDPNPADRKAVLEPARRLLVVYVVGIVGVGLVGLLGLIGLVILGVRLLSGRLQGGLDPGTGNGGIYAETFAVWMFLFLALSVIREWVAKDAGFLGAGLVSLLSLGALAWPLLRGVSEAQLRHDIGWTTGRNLFSEVFLGPASYAMTLPFMLAGLILTMILLIVQSVLAGVPPDSFTPVSLPSHPIIEAIRAGNWQMRLQLLFVASVVAPVVEETMFRGVLYRHLREATWGWGSAFSVVCSIFVTSFIFAVIHPQGLVAVPALMGIATGLNLAREWRQTLIPGMIAHGINNGLLLVLLSLALG
jgi:membrane protease YdiL (CAAX protease family)